MLAHGFDIPLMVELVRDGLATATPERLRAGKIKMEIARVRITEAGCRALAKMLGRSVALGGDQGASLYR